MAYKPETLKIIPKGLQLVSPGDVDPDACLDLSGFWSGAAGRLEQCPGIDALSAMHLSVPLFDGVCQSSGRTYYSAAGSLYQVGRGGGGETAIDSGYDTGYPLAMIGFQGYLWVINKNKQRKDDGSTVTDWTPAAPSAPTVTNPALTSASQNIGECDPATAGSGGYYTQINMFVPGSDDLSGLVVGGTVTIASAGVAAFNGTWRILQIYAQPGTVGDTSQLVVLAATLPPGTTPTPVGVGAGKGGVFTYAAPGMPPGSYSYSITWQFADLGESNPCTAVAKSVSSNGTKILVDITALTPPGGTTGWNVYRQGPGLSWPYRVNENYIPIATKTYSDYGDASHSQDNDYLTEALGAELEMDHDAAPAARIMADNTYNGRIVVANSATYPNRVWYTPPLQPAFFRGSADPVGGDWVDIGTDRGDAILYIAVKPQQLIVYRQKSIWRVLYDFEDASSRIEVVVPDLGATGARAVVASSQGDYFRGPEGVYKFNGDWAQKISGVVDPIFRGISTENFPGEVAGTQANCALGLHAGRLWVSYTGAGSVNTSTLIYHLDTQRWFGGPGAWSFGAFYNAGDNLLGAGNYAIYTLETGWSANGNYAVMHYQSAYLDAGLPDHEKTFGDIVVNHMTGGQDWSIVVHTNKASDPTNDIFTLDATLNSTELTKSTVPLIYPNTYAISGLRGKPIRSYNLSIVIQGVGPTSDGPAILDTPILLHYYLEARKARRFDTDEQDHGMPAIVKSVDEVEFDVDNSLSLITTLQIYSDVPGKSMAARLGAGLGLGQTTGRTTVRLVMPFLIDGKLLRYEVYSDKVFEIYAARARLTPIGVYVDGSIGEIWSTAPIPVGI